MKQNRLLVFGFVMLLGLLFGMTSVKPAAAGSNGQQLKISVGCDWSSVTVTGKNQNGQTKTWKAVNNWKPWECKYPTVYTTGYWWVGEVKIVRHNYYKECKATVPKSQWLNWYSTACW